MDLSALIKSAGKAAAKNSPAILTAIGVTGTLSTAYFAARGAFKAKEILDEASENISTTEEAEHFSSLKGKAELTWKCYVPAVGMAVMTVVAIVGANRISDRRTAALASAYSIAEKGIQEYREKVVEKVGKNKEAAVREELAQDRVNKNPVDRNDIIVVNDRGNLCYDAYFGRYFTSDIETIRSAVNDLNLRVINESYASVSDLWELIGLPSTTASNFLGWTTDQKLEVSYNWVSVKGSPCLEIDFMTSPVFKYDRAF